MDIFFKRTKPLPVFLFFLLFFSALPVRAASGDSLVEPAQLKKWLDNGSRTEKGERVVVIDVTPNQSEKESWFAGDTEAVKQMTVRKFGEHSPQYESILQLDRKGALGHIPGALYQASHSGGEVAVRSEGPIKTEHEVANGAQFDAMLQGLGITADDVLVLTSSQQNPWMVCGARLWWTLYYWGFPQEKIKLLDGSNKGYAFVGYPLEKGAQTPTVTASKISVAGPTPKHLDVRVSLQEMISLVDTNKTSNGDVYLLDNRQPPAAFYLKDERNKDGAAVSDGIPDMFQLPGFSYNPINKLFTRDSDKTVFSLSEMLFAAAANDGKIPRAAFDMKVNPPIQFPNPYLGIHSTPAIDHFAIPISIKSAAFEGIIKGAHLTKTAAYNITVPMLVSPDNRFKDKAELIALFAKAGIDGTKPIILYCNSGALSSFYFYALHEICGFTNVRIYDGSWMEWSNLTAFEPADATYVRKDNQLIYPGYPAMMPALYVFDGMNNYLEWNGKEFINAATGKPAPASQVKPGVNLQGNLRWDTIHRSEHIVFRPSATINDPKRYQTYNKDTDWPEVDTSPDYNGSADKIMAEDSSYRLQ